jgi:hypothetical protein
MFDEDRRKHLDMVQGVITRLAGNSFSIKGWAVALIAVLGAFAAKDTNLRFALTLWLPALCFWGLDAYYLRQEKLYRKLYEKVVACDPKVPPFTMNSHLCESEVEGTVKVAFSPTVLWLHVPIILFVAAVTIYALAKPAKGDLEKTSSSSTSVSSVPTPSGK